MTISATVTSKGQTTIPKQFRDKYGIALNGKVTWVERPDGLLLQSATSSVDEVVGLLKSSIPYAGKDAERAAVGKYLADRQAK
jgi:bifunctional DNA-binding transcriptional regulator/antitoxin component of YhaV-PrlF toxin-antitoxin module